MDVLIIVFLVLVGIVSFILFMYQMIHNSDLQNYPSITDRNVFDLLFESMNLPAYMNSKGIKIYSSFYMLFIIPLIIYIPIALLRDKNKKNRIKKKMFIKQDEIFEFCKYDRIKMKDGKIVIIEKFTNSSFSDSSKNIYNWIDALENESYTVRNRDNKNKIKYKMFEKNADTFQKKSQEFMAELEKQQNEILERFNKNE